MNDEAEVTFQDVIEMLVKLEHQLKSEEAAFIAEYEWLRAQMIRGIKAIRLAELHFDEHANRLWRKEFPDIDEWLAEMETATNMDSHLGG